MGGLQPVGGQFLQLLNERPAGDVDGGKAERDRARAARAAAGLQLRGVALDEVDPVEVDAEITGRDLAVGSGMALAVRHGADEDAERAVLFQAHLCALRAGKGAGLHIGGKADAAREPARPAVGAPGLEAGPVGDLKGLVQMAGELADVIGAPAGRRVGEGVPEQ